MQHDLFICHASEDKTSLVRPLADALKAANLDVWYDEFSLDVGDSLRQSIDRGLAGARYGVVVLSPAFFTKPWTQRELDGLVAREMGARRKLILPIWHGVSQEDVLQYSPPLADSVALPSSLGIEELAARLARRVSGEESPFVAARDELLRFGFVPPPFSDEWWLDQVEMQEEVHESRWRRSLVFPLPHNLGSVGRERGLNIAWTTLQLDWRLAAEVDDICQMTPPDAALAFIRNRPALLEACVDSPERLANYLPQLLIPEFSAEFGPAFDRLLHVSIDNERTEPDKARPWATCGRAMALRHPELGSHRPADIASHWVQGEGGSLSAAAHNELNYILWLLADDSLWLPATLRSTLLEGLRVTGYWAAEVLTRRNSGSPLFTACFAARQPVWAIEERHDLEDLIDEMKADRPIETSTEVLAERFIDAAIVEACRVVMRSRRND